ncbi:hypothetical protein MMC14_009644 [Varicellaria rhodocarpa]|nr:hypothetical protein [Varicellaria rhodocarpa]
MRPSCLCLRAPSGSSCTKTAHGQQKDLAEVNSRRNATPEPETAQRPVRAVSPADVRRTESGRLVKQRYEGLQAITEPSSSMRVLGGSQLKEHNLLDCGPLSSCMRDVRSAEVQHGSKGKTDVKRILQPVPQHPGTCKPQKSLLQLLRPARFSSACSQDQADPATATVAPSACCKSILEASQKRLLQYTEAAPAPSDASARTAMQTFSDAYLLAVSEGNQQWANVAVIAALFSPDAVLVTQDKQTFHGKISVLRRLNAGAS